MKKSNSQHVVTAGGGLFFDDSIHGRIGLRAGHPARAPRVDRASYTRDAVARTVRGSPEIIVRIVGHGQTIGDARGQVKYVTKGSVEPLEDERGKRWAGDRAVERSTYTWQRGGMGLPEKGTRHETLHVVLWTPKGSDPSAVTDAARATMRAEFDGHRYVFAPHQDTGHPHVHAIVVIGRTDGAARMNPRKVDLARWRESFAVELRDRGVDANATRRVVRGVLAREDARGRKPIVASPETQRKIERQWESVARELDRGDARDRQIAGEARSFVDRMPARSRERERAVAAPSVAPDS